MKYCGAWRSAALQRPCAHGAPLPRTPADGPAQPQRPEEAERAQQMYTVLTRLAGYGFSGLLLLTRVRATWATGHTADAVECLHRSNGANTPAFTCQPPTPRSASCQRYGRQIPQTRRLPARTAHLTPAPHSGTSHSIACCSSPAAHVITCPVLTIPPCPRPRRPHLGQGLAPGLRHRAHGVDERLDGPHPPLPEDRSPRAAGLVAGARVVLACGPADQAQQVSPCQTGRGSGRRAAGCASGLGRQSGKEYSKIVDSSVYSGPPLSQSVFSRPSATAPPCHPLSATEVQCRGAFADGSLPTAASGQANSGNATYSDTGMRR
jgi:hypothetical protein